MNSAPIYEGRDLEALAEMPNYYRWIIDTYRPWISGRTMEIGTGTGTIAKRLLKFVDELILVEPSVHLTELISASIVNDKKVSIFNESLEQRLPQMPDQSCDTIVMVNVLEHIENDELALQSLSRVLKPGGRLLLFIPAMQFLFSEMDVYLGHYRRYHLAPLQSLLENNGFELVHKKYFDVFGILPWWFLYTRSKRTTFNPKMAEIYDSFFIPITRQLERWISPPFGKNIIIVAVRNPD